MTHDRPSQRGRLNWLLPWLLSGALSGFFYLADLRIASLEQRITEDEKMRITFNLEYVQDRASLLEGQRQILRDMRTLCGNKNLSKPCAMEDK